MDNPVNRDCRGSQEFPDKLDNPDRLRNRDQQDQLVRLVQMANLGSQVSQEQLGSLDSSVKVPLSMGQPVHQGQMVSRVAMDSLANLAPMDIRGHKVLPAMQDQMERQAMLVNPERQDKPESKEAKADVIIVHHHGQRQAINNCANAKSRKSKK